MKLDTFLRNLLGVEGNGLLILQLFVAVFGVVLLNVVLQVVLARLRNRLERTKTPWDDALIGALQRPLIWLIWILGVTFAADIFQRHLKAPAAIFEVIDPVREIAVITLLAWFLIRLIRRVETNLIRQRQVAGRPVDRTTADAMSKLLRLSVIITAVLVTLQTLGFSISGVLAFGGVGGIAVGFAARDLLANFFGGLMVYLDRPFNVGDWIRSPDRDIEGTVEHIGWRLTRIRTFDLRPLYVPNSTFATVAVENPSRMSNRRIYETIGIRYNDAAKVASIVEDVKAFLAGNADVAQEQTLMVNFTRFNASSLDFFVYCFTKTINWTEYHRVKQEILLGILAIVEKNGAEVAFPTSTLHFPDDLVVRSQHSGVLAEQADSSA